MASGLRRRASSTPEPASLSETFHWMARSTLGGGGRMPDVSTSIEKPRPPSARSRGTNSGDSSGSPPVTTARRQG